MFSELLSTTKVKIVDEMMQSAYLCVILYVKHKKTTISYDLHMISNSW